MVISYTNTIFNANPNAAEMRRPSLVVGDVDTTAINQCAAAGNENDQNERFNSNTVTGLQFVASRIPWTVMHIKTDVVAQVVWEKRRNRLISISWDQFNRKGPTGGTDISREIKANLLELILETILGNAVELI